MITSLGAEAVERAQAIARQADIIAALTLEVLKGTTKAFDSGEIFSNKTETFSSFNDLTCFFFFFFLLSFYLVVDIHRLRPHPGQIEVAQRFRSLLDSDHHPSEIAGVCLHFSLLLQILSKRRVLYTMQTSHV